MFVDWLERRSRVRFVISSCVMSRIGRLCDIEHTGHEKTRSSKEQYSYSNCVLMSWKFAVNSGVVWCAFSNSKDLVADKFVYCSLASLQICHNVSAVSAIILA